MGVCVRKAWLDSDIESERSVSTSESRRLIKAAEQRAAEHARQIAEQSRYGRDIRSSKDSLADSEQCIEGMCEHLAEQKPKHSRL